MNYSTIINVLLLAVSSANGFVVPSATSPRPTTLLQLSSSTASGNTATLTDTTTWRFTLNLYGLPTVKGKRSDQLFVMETKFVEEEGYEPPQGCLLQVGLDGSNAAADGDAEDADGESSSNSNKLELTSSRWQLSEDPNDRKDGLWVWGLFKEPLYPYLLLQMETKEIPLPGSDGDAIKPLKLYAQITHKRDKDTGMVELGSASLNVREVETIKADPFGAASVDLYDDVDVGRLSIVPV